jgi:hypothetical protein
MRKVITVKYARERAFLLFIIMLVLTTMVMSSCRRASLSPPPAASQATSALRFKKGAEVVVRGEFKNTGNTPIKAGVCLDSDDVSQQYIHITFADYFTAVIKGEGRAFAFKGSFTDIKSEHSGTTIVIEPGASHHFVIELSGAQDERGETLGNSPGLYFVTFGHILKGQGIITPQQLSIEITDAIDDIWIAADRSSMSDIRSFLKGNPQLVNAKDSQGETPLHKAARKGHRDAASYLIAQGAIVDEKNIYTQTPLQIAANEGTVEIVELLLSKGAKVNGKDRMDQTALHYAACGVHKEGIRMPEILIKYGADVNVRSKNNQTPLHMATASGQSQIAEFLRKHGGKE